MIWFCRIVTDLWFVASFFVAWRYGVVIKQRDGAKTVLKALEFINADLRAEAANATADRDAMAEELAQERADRKIKEANRLIRKRKGALAGWEKRRERAA